MAEVSPRSHNTSSGLSGLGDAPAPCMGWQSGSLQAGWNYSGKRLSKIQWILSMNLSLFSSSCQHRRYNIHCGGFWRGGRGTTLWYSQSSGKLLEPSTGNDFTSLGFTGGLSRAHLLIFQEHWFLWGWNQDITHSCGDTLMCKRRKGSFPAHFLFGRCIPSASAPQNLVLATQHY